MAVLAPMPSASVRIAGGRETALAHEHAHGVARVLPEIAEHVTGGRAWRDRRGRLRLPERRQVLRERGAAPERTECAALRLVG